MAMVKKSLGNKGNYYNVFKKWVPKSEESEAMESQAHMDMDQYNASMLNKAIHNIAEAKKEGLDRAEVVGTIPTFQILEALGDYRISGMKYDSTAWKRVPLFRAMVFWDKDNSDEIKAYQDELKRRIRDLNMLEAAFKDIEAAKVDGLSKIEVEATKCVWHMLRLAGFEVERDAFSMLLDYRTINGKPVKFWVSWGSENKEENNVKTK